VRFLGVFFGEVMCSHELFACWLQTVILLISASGEARITDENHCAQQIILITE
jgi:hypothetical protein